MIGSCPDLNDLSEAGYKFSGIKEGQINLIKGYDINTEIPLFARIFRGSCNDRSTIKDLSELLEISGVLFVVDRGFYSAGNLEIFSSNGNTYVIPVPSNTDCFREAMCNVRYEESFYYRFGNKHSRIEYTSKRISDLNYIYVFRAIEENEKSRFNYCHNMELGRNGYKEDGFEKNKENFGVYVLQSNSGMTAKEVFETYKRRWDIKTFYQYIKNGGDFNNLMFQSYYKEQGFSFIMLITGQIHQKMISAVRSLDDNTLSGHDVMLIARCMKMERRGNSWNLKNTRKRDFVILMKMGFEPRMIVQD